MKTEQETFRRRIITFTIIIAVALVFGYTYYEASELLAGPQLLLVSPTDEYSVATEPLFKIRGTAKNVSSVKVDGRPIYTKPDGSFDDMFLLLPGHNVLEIKAADKFGRINAKVLNVFLKNGTMENLPTGQAGATTSTSTDFSSFSEDAPDTTTSASDEATTSR